MAQPERASAGRRRQSATARRGRLLGGLAPPDPPTHMAVFQTLPQSRWPPRGGSGRARAKRGDRRPSPTAPSGRASPTPDAEGPAPPAPPFGRRFGFSLGRLKGRAPPAGIGWCRTRVYRTGPATPGGPDGRARAGRWWGLTGGWRGAAEGSVPVRGGEGSPPARGARVWMPVGSSVGCSA